ncbi:unnamed protein product [Prorocentrum cordatum]|uniref:Reverse transcriptase domain-containing protein n=1 Tax=Prorocentrum cordatum TaxID=2364126 RepID=A0ABN9VNQ2_9DINO|nr:unnamed protein product [Polarella glacialis]
MYDFRECEVVARLGARLVAPLGGKCMTRDEWSTIDYFLVDRRLEAQVLGVEVMNKWSSRPRKQRRLRLHAKPVVSWIREPVAPTTLPMGCPIGSERNPVGWPALEASPLSQKDLDGVHAQVITALEVLQRHDLVGDAGARYRGRGEALRWRTVPQWAPRTWGHASQSRHAFHLQALEDLLRELFHLARRAEARPLDEPQRQRPGLLHERLLRRARWIHADIERGEVSQVAFDSASDERGQIDAVRTVIQGAAGHAGRGDQAAARAQLRQRFEEASMGNGQCRRPASDDKANADVAKGNATAAEPRAMCEDVHGVPRTWLEGAADDEPLPVLDGPAMRNVTGRFKERTGLGVENWNPRVLRHSSAAAVDAFAQLLMTVEASPLWLAQINLLVDFRIPKAAGGLRPIGKMPTLDLQGGPDCDAAATVLLDLAKCFEWVRLKHVWARGLRRGFPKRVLRIMLVSFSAARTVVLGDCYSNLVSVISAIVPGSRFAMAAAHLLMIEPCDITLARWPVDLSKCADDLALAQCGGAAEDAEGIAEAVTWFVGCLRDELDLEVSLSQGNELGKSAALGTSCWLARALRLRLRRLSIRVARESRHLCLDRLGETTDAQRGLGRRPGLRPVRRGRLKAMVDRSRPLKRAKAQGAAVWKVAKIGLKPAAIYGHKALALTPPEVQRARTMVGQALLGKTRLKSTSLRLACFGEDPGDAGVAPSIMQAAWRRQQVALLGDDAWKGLRGPASSVILTAREIGWTWPAWDTFITREGIHINVLQVCQRDVLAQANWDAKREQWARWIAADGERASLTAMPFIEPLRSFCDQHRRHWGAGMAFASQACMRALGTAQHRLGGCPGYWVHRQAMPATWQYAIETSLDRLRWDRGLTAHPGWKRPFTPQVERNIDRAELHAVAVVLDHAMPPLRVHVDRQSVLDGITADIGLGPNGIEFGKVKAHRTDAQLQGASAAERLVAMANRGADAWAGEGAAGGGNEWLAYVQQAWKETAAQVRFALNFQAELAERVFSTEDDWPDMQPPPPRGSQAPRIGLQLVAE